MKTLPHSAENAVVAMGQGEKIDAPAETTRRDAQITEAMERRAREDARQSPDPMRGTDRYRLVTPYFSSVRDL